MQTFEVTSGQWAEHASTVSTAHFGAIYSTFYGMEAFLTQAELLNIKSFRWPGGTRGEMARDTEDKDNDGNTQEYLFDLNHEDLMVIDGKGLSNVLQAAVRSDASLAIFLPSHRYLDDLSGAKEDASRFIKRLLDGEFGALPKELVIELGNETLDGSIERATAYGRVADAQLSGIRDALSTRTDDHAGSLSFAVQMGRSAAEDQAIREAIDPDNLASIDHLISHHLPINIRNHNRVLTAESEKDIGDSRFTRSIDYVDDWSTAASEAREEPAFELRSFVSAWTVGPSSDFDETLLDFQDIGARQGRTTIDTFAQLLAAGADSASLWGVDARSNPNFFSKLEDGTVNLSHGGHAFAMMSEKLIGSTLLQGHTQRLDEYGYLADPAWVYAYENEDFYTLFVVANDIDEPARVLIDLDEVDLTRKVEVKRLSTMPPSQEGGEGVPVIETSFIDLHADSFEFVLREDYEVDRLTIWKLQSEAEEICTVGTPASAVRFGSSWSSDSYAEVDPMTTIDEWDITT